MTELAPHRTTTDLSFTDQAEFARMVTSGGRAQSILPDAYRDNPANVLVAVGLGASMGLSPAESLYRISVIKGKPSAGAELIAANVRRAGHKLRVRVTENPPSATAQIIRADDPDFPFEVTRDMDWAKQMGLASNDNYKKQASTMLQWRAITAVARLACPEALYGVAYTPDEVGEAVGPEQPAQRRVTAAEFTTPTESPHLAPEPVEPDKWETVTEPPAPASPPPTPTPPPADVTDAEVLPDDPAEAMITDAQSRKMGALMREDGLTDRAEAIAWVSTIIGRQIASRNELTKREASTVIDTLVRQAEDKTTQPADEDPWARAADTAAQAEQGDGQ